MDKKWYMITTISGKEDKVIESLKNRVVSENMQDDFDEFKVMRVPHLTPRELAKKNANEPHRVREVNLYPGYIFIRMRMGNEAWFLVRNTEYVTGLVGSSGQRTKPTPVSNLEMRKMIKRVEKIRHDFDAGIVRTNFVPGVIVEIIDGPAKGQIGPILENDDERQVANVELIMFERKTPTEISYKDLKIRK
ncbi:uncharacterized protein LOC111627160 [Centruroides sculpturatus]|uniref:uncharacterized protein LOC111627160 n=1 Tax=Centruroides sculpturatus TaxID=218467 RepID=UPI000C6C9669|nr:uncharacterized protein LOC111627160 [Centruroides sculpturatus]